MSDIRTAPPNTFRVTGYDQYDYNDYHFGDFPSLREAIAEVEKRISLPNGDPTAFSNVFFVHDAAARCLFRASYDEGIVKTA